MADPREESGQDARVTTLIAGIIQDVRDLVCQHLALFKLEMNNKSETAQKGVQALQIGREIAVVGSLCVVFTVVSALHDLVPAVPLSACYGIVGLPLLIAGEPPGALRTQKAEVDFVAARRIDSGARGELWMARENEIVQQQIMASRSGIVEKLEALEDHLVDTMEGAADNIGATVATVTGVIQETTQAAQETVLETTNTARETMTKGSEAAHELAQAISGALDVKEHVRRSPWTMVGLCVGLGYLAEHRLRVPVPCSPAAAGDIPASGNGLSSPRKKERLPFKGSKNSLSALPERLAPAMAQLENLAIATLIGLVRDVTTQAVPPNVATRLRDVFDSATIQLGADPVPGPILPQCDRRQIPFHLSDN